MSKIINPTVNDRVIIGILKLGNDALIIRTKTKHCVTIQVELDYFAS